jgi:hypothetical protein
MFVGPGVTCALLFGGEVRCAGQGGGLGLRGPGFQPVPSLHDAVDIALGKTDGCAILPSDNELHCFGTHFGSVDAPPALPNLVAKTSSRIAAGDDVFCALKESLLTCFDGSYPQTRRPLEPGIGVEGKWSVRDVAVTGNAVCGIDFKGGRCAPPMQDVGVLGGVTDIATAPGRLCGLRDNGDVVCTSATAKDPGPPVATNAVAIAMSSRGLCVLHRSREVSCEEAPGKLALLSGVYSVRSIAGGGGDFCFVKQDFVTFCWGDNANGELGMSGRKDVPTALFFRASP